MRHKTINIVITNEVIKIIENVDFDLQKTFLDGWMGVNVVLMIAYSNQNSYHDNNNPTRQFFRNRLSFCDSWKNLLTSIFALADSAELSIKRKTLKRWKLANCVE